MKNRRDILNELKKLDQPVMIYVLNGKYYHKHIKGAIAIRIPNNYYNKASLIDGKLIFPDEINREIHKLPGSVIYVKAGQYFIENPGQAERTFNAPVGMLLNAGVREEGRGHNKKLKRIYFSPKSFDEIKKLLNVSKLTSSDLDKSESIAQSKYDAERIFKKLYIHKGNREAFIKCKIEIINSGSSLFSLFLMQENKEHIKLMFASTTLMNELTPLERAKLIAKHADVYFEMIGNKDRLADAMMPKNINFDSRDKAFVDVMHEIQSAMRRHPVFKKKNPYESFDASNQFIASDVDERFMQKPTQLVSRERQYIPFNQGNLINRMGDDAQYKTLNQFNMRFGGLCELISNYVIMNDMLGKNESRNLSKNSFSYYANDNNQLVLVDNIKLNNINTPEVKKSHILDVSSLFQKFKAIVLDSYPHDLFSFWEKLGNNQIFNKKQVKEKFDTLPNNFYIKLCVFGNDGLDFSGHSMVIKKVGDNKYSFFDPDEGEYKNLSFEQMADKIEKVIKVSNGNKIAFLDGGAYINELKKNQEQALASQLSQPPAFRQN